MKTPNDGGPAFPWHQSPGNQNNLGMSLRDWFAGQALCGMLSRENLQYALADKTISVKACALSCYDWADELLKARSHSDTKNADKSHSDCIQAAFGDHGQG